MDNKWFFKAQTCRGLLHKKRGVNCQDVFAYKKEADIYTAVLIDGVGKTNDNAKVGKAVSEVMADMACDNFNELYKLSDTDIAYNTMINLNDVYWNMSKKWHIPYHEMSSTLMILGVDDQKKRYLSIHLGDGIIISKDNKIKIISYPQNGYFSNQTILTDSETAIKHIRINRGAVDNQTMFALMTDGMYSLPIQHDSIESVCDNFLDVGEISDQGEDDKGIVILRRESYE